ncbi:helix-turn-helix domain-containing protein [Kitasatospora sp. NPDC006697]|uniref:helix-turn-helix domain-containing protein n=1 Tax=Kitasatospora sp. NPDC006697 TaxID=3364020 RepID=UPI0036CE8AE1
MGIGRIRAGASPIAARVARWRARRGLTVRQLARRSGIAAERLAALEQGADWLDRRRDLAALAGALRVDAVELTGRPYPPSGAEHAAVDAVAFHLRRELAEPGALPPAGRERELARRTETATAAARDGDELLLARTLPGLIRLGAGAVALAPAGTRRQAAELRLRGHLAAAGLLRRLGHRDLAWAVLHRARGGAAGARAVLAEELQLLLDMALPEQALARAAEGPGSAALLALAALAEAAAGRPAEAERRLRRAAGRAGLPSERDALALTRVRVAAEAGSPAEVLALADAAELPPAARAGVLTLAASAHARLGEPAAAAARLLAAERTAPLRTRLDPLARELLAVLPARLTDPAQAAAVHRLASRAGTG